MEEHVTISLIIPVYNEEKNLPSALPKISKWLNDGKGKREAVFVDDRSDDRSVELIRNCSERHGGIRLICLDRNQGKGAAVRSGMLAAVGEYRIFTDCDLAYGIDAVRRIEEKLKMTNAPAVIGSRVLHPNGYGHYSAFRKLMSRAYVEILRSAAGLSYSDFQCGIKGFTADAACRIFSVCQIDGFAFDLEVLTVAKKLRLNAIEMPVNIVRHSQENSKISPFKDTFKMLLEVMRIKRLHRELSSDTSEVK